MTERLTCTNCGAPITRQGNETRGTCTHCQHVTEFPPVSGYGPPQQGYGPPQQGYGPPQQGYGPPQQGGYGPPHQGGYGPPQHRPSEDGIPQILIIQQPAATRTVVVNRGGGSGLISYLIYLGVFLALSGGVGGFVHHRHSMNTAASAPAGGENPAAAAGEKAAKEAAERAEKAQREAAAAEKAAGDKAAAEHAAAEHPEHPEHAEKRVPVPVPEKRPEHHPPH